MATVTRGHSRICISYKLVYRDRNRNVPRQSECPADELGYSRICIIRPHAAWASSAGIRSPLSNFPRMDPVPARQREIYLGASQGLLPSVPTQSLLLEERARRKMSRVAYAYVAGGAGLEETQRRNRDAFSRWQIVPRVLRDVRQRDLGVELWGRRLASPLFLCPVGVLELAHREADLAVARAAAACGLPMIFSNQASVCMEECARTMGDSPRWFQLYWSKSDELVASLLQRAERCGCEALVVTLDTALLGWRPRDLDMASLPFLRGAGLAQYLTDPVFQALVRDGPPDPPARVSWAGLKLLLHASRSHPGDFLGNLRSRRAVRAVRRFLDLYSRADLTWDRLEFLRSKTRLPIVLKGILSAQDAVRALDLGVDGIYVSNHGGRQVDGSISSLEALADIAPVVAGRVPILFDSGVRSGADVARALALGANAVGIGRPYVYALALAGQRGVEELVHNLTAELDLTLALAGATRPCEVQLVQSSW